MRSEYLGLVRGGRLRDVFADGEGPPTDAPEGAWLWVREGAPAPFAEPASARADICALALAGGFDPVLPPACEAEAAAWAADPGIADPALVDLTGLAFVTIDYETSKDLDQALFIADAGDGHVVWYALADAAYYVRPGSALLAEALRRGATMYLPGLTVPMLPRGLCEGLVSLNAAVERRAMVFEMALDGLGTVTATKIHRARIRSRAKLAYADVQAWYDGGPAPTDDAAALASLRRLAAVGERRLRDAELRDVVRPRHDEVDVHLGGKGMKFVVSAAPRSDVERYNEQISLMTNVCGARFLRDGDRPDDVVQPVFRTHAPPDEARLESLSAQIDRLVRAHGLPERWQWRSGAQSLSDYLRGLPDEGEAAGVAGAIQRQALLTGGRSGFSAAPAPHHGVGADVYARFTAPMREVVGIFVHKETWEKLGVVTPAPNADDVYLREQVIEAANRGKAAQRKLTQDANRLVLDQLFELDRAAGAPPRPATVMGIGSGKVHVQLRDPAIDLKVYIPDIEAQIGGATQVDRTQAALLDAAGQVLFTTGDLVEVGVVRRDVDRDRWVLALSACRSNPTTRR